MGLDPCGSQQRRLARYFAIADQKKGEKGNRRGARGAAQKRPSESFIIASANEGTEVLGAPAWRVNLGNIAAGATAGATVEAGQPTLAVLNPSFLLHTMQHAKILHTCADTSLDSSTSESCSLFLSHGFTRLVTLAVSFVTNADENEVL